VSKGEDFFPFFIQRDKKFSNFILQELYPKNKQKLKAVKIKFFARQIPVFDAQLKTSFKNPFPSLFFSKIPLFRKSGIVDSI